MVGVAYAKRPVVAKGLVYCDTSFLLDNFAHQVVTDGRLPRLLKDQSARAKRASDFRKEAEQKGAVFVTSIFAVEEGFQKLLFAPIWAAASPGGFRDWKKFRAADPTAFATAIDLGRHAVARFETFLKMAAIDLLFLGKQPPPNRPILESHLVAIMRLLIAKYEAEAMDTLHYAVMRRFRIPAAASSDTGWLQFSRGTLFTDI
jgi:phytoene dehydrogenase-like protein